MTPELLARFRSPDEAVAEEAAEEWERRGEAYRAYLARVEDALPAAVRELLARYWLHDAKVLTIAKDERSYFSLFLELENPRDPADRYLELRYRLPNGDGKGWEAEVHKELEGDGKPLAWWLYDEIERIEGASDGYGHSILLTGGWEIRIRFSALECIRLNFVAAPAEGAVEQFVKLSA